MMWRDKKREGYLAGRSIKRPTQGGWGRGALAGVLLLGLMPSGAAIADTQAQLSTGDQEQLDALVARLTTLVGENQAMTTLQMEGRLILAVNQAQTTCTIGQLALARLMAIMAKQPPAIRAAISRAAAAARYCTGGSIAGITNNGPAVVQQGTTLGLAGGSSNYLSTP